MTTLQPPPAQPKSTLRSLLKWAVVVIPAAIFVGLAVIAIPEIEKHQKYLAEKRRLEEAGKTQRPYMDAARESMPLIEARMRAERPRRVANIAIKTGLPPIFIESHFGWFTGMDDSVLKEQKSPEEKDWHSFWVLHEEIKKRYSVLAPPRGVLAAFDPVPEPVVIYETMTTEQAVKNLIHTESTLSLRSTHSNPVPYEGKYDTRKDTTALDEALNRLFMKPEISFAWMIEREGKAVGEPNLDSAVVRVIDYLSGAVDRRIEFMTNGLSPVSERNPLPKGKEGE